MIYQFVKSKEHPKSIWMWFLKESRSCQLSVFNLSFRFLVSLHREFWSFFLLLAIYRTVIWETSSNPSWMRPSPRILPTKGIETFKRESVTSLDQRHVQPGGLNVTVSFYARGREPESTAEMPGGCSPNKTKKLIKMRLRRRRRRRRHGKCGIADAMDSREGKVSVLTRRQ